MSTVIMAACWPLRMSPAQKAVLISLADNANDEGYCWPCIETISARTCLSERAVRNAVRWLGEQGAVQVMERRGRSSMYRVTPQEFGAESPRQDMHPGTKCPPAPDAPHPGTKCPPPRQEVPDTPAPGAPRTVKNRKEPQRNRQGGAQRTRPTRLPEKFMLTGEMRAWAAERVPGVEVTHETEKFVNHFRGNGKTMVDWVAAWRNWLLRAQEDVNGWRRPRASPGQLNHDDTSWANDLGGL